MDRKEKIYEELKSYSGSGEAEGLDAQQLAELTGIDRANVSRKLNELGKGGKSHKAIWTSCTVYGARSI